MIRAQVYVSFVAELLYVMNFFVAETAAGCRYMQKELKRKRVAEERKRSREEEAGRLRKLEEERMIMEEKERERMRHEEEKMDELEREKNRRVEEQQRRLAEAMQRAREERARKLEEETELLGREEEEREKKRCREMMEKETEAALKNRNRWYYEGGNTDWQEDRRLSAGKLADKDPGQQMTLSRFSKLPPLNPADQKDATDMVPISLRSECPSSLRQTPNSDKSRTTSRDAKPGGLLKRRQKSAAKKFTCKTELAAAADDHGPDHVSAEVTEILDMGVPTTMKSEAAENK